MLVIFQSQTVKKDKELTPEKFLTEKWYQKEFMIEEYQPDFMSHLKTVLP
jgi:ribosomal protein L16 Arg81 hydroxylase